MAKIRMMNKKANYLPFLIGAILAIALLFAIFSLFGKDIYFWFVKNTPGYNASSGGGGIQLVGYELQNPGISFYDSQNWIPIEQEKAFQDKIIYKEQVIEDIQKIIGENLPAQIAISGGRSSRTNKIYRPSIVIEGISEDSSLIIWHSYRESGEIKNGYLLLTSKNRLLEEDAESNIWNMPYGFVTNEGKIKKALLTEPYVAPREPSEYAESILDELEGLDFPELSYSKFFGKNPNPDAVIEINNDFQFIQTSASTSSVTYVLKKRGSEAPVYLRVEKYIASGVNEDPSSYESILQEEAKMPYSILEIPIKASSEKFTKDITSTNPSDPEYEIVQKVSEWKSSLFSEPVEIRYTKKSDRDGIQTFGEFCLDVRPERIVIDFNKPDAEAPCSLA